MVVKLSKKSYRNNPISERAKEIWGYIAALWNCFGGMESWYLIAGVHVMFCAAAQLRNCGKFMDAYKIPSSSRLLLKNLSEIREKLWKEAFWSQRVFCLFDEPRGTSRSNAFNISKPRERKRIEAWRSIIFLIYPTRRTEDTSWQNIWLLSFSVQSDADGQISRSIK